MRYIFICSLPARQHFFRLISEKHAFRRNKKYKVRVLIFQQIFPEKFVILRRTERDMIKNIYWHSCNVSIILLRFEWNVNFFSTYFRKPQKSNFTKNHPVGAELIHADRRTDGRTDMTKLIVAFRNFEKEPKNALHEDLCIFQNLVALVCHNWGRTFCLWCRLGRQSMIWPLRYNGQALSIAGLCVYDISVFMRYRIWSFANLLLRYSYFHCFMRIIQ